MDKSDYVRLLKESSINDETKFKPVSAERPKMRGRPPKHFHPLLEKEKELTAALKEFFTKILLIPLFKKVQDLPTCMVYQRLTRNNWRCAPCYPQQVRITTS